jgi:hypothetical protein
MAKEKEPESFEFEGSKDKKKAKEIESLQSRPISELSTEEIETVLMERGIDISKEKGEKFRSEREARRNKFLQDLRNGLTMGEPQAYKGLTIRGAEYIGIYKDGKYLGDIVSDDNLTGMTDKEFQDKAYELVAKGLGKKTDEYGREKPRVEVNVDVATKKIMNQMNMILSGDNLTLQNDEMDIDLYNNGENDKIDILKIDEEKILLRITEKNGKIIEYTVDRGFFQPESRRVKLGK